MLYIIPIEPYQNRYSSQWNRWFPDYLTKNSIDHFVVHSEEGPRTLDSRNVLDVFATNCTKYKQLIRICDLIESGRISNGDALLFHTLWFSGLDSLQYMRQSLGIKFKITGVLHAGTYDPADFRTRSGMREWAIHLERAWLTLVDRIFVATDFHKRLVLESIPIDPHKIDVTRLPLWTHELRSGRQYTAKEDLVAFPHRLVPEKDPDVVERLRGKLPGISIVRTRDICHTQDQFYDLLARCKVCISNSFQETFGYAMLEAAALGCIPLVPDRLAYRELYPEEFRFKDEDELAEKIRDGVRKWRDPTPSMNHIFTQCEKSIERMVDLTLAEGAKDP